MPKAITVVQGATAGEDGKIELQYSTALDLGNGRGVNFGSNASVKTGPTAPEWRTALRAKAATDCAVYGASLQAADVTLGDEISKSGEAPPQTRVSVETYGAVGDGVADDTVSIQQALTDQQIASAIYYPVPLHQQKVFASMAAGTSFPVTESVAARCLSLPIYPELSNDAVDEICGVIRQALKA